MTVRDIYNTYAGKVMIHKGFDCVYVGNIVSVDMKLLSEKIKFISTNNKNNYLSITLF